MIYGYGMWRQIEQQLKKEFSEMPIRNIQKFNKVKQLLSKNEISKKDLLFFLRFSEGDQRLQHQLQDEGYNLFPNPSFSKFIQNRKNYLTEIDKWTKFPLKRIYSQFENQSYQTIRSMIAQHFGNSEVIMKVGNLHASEGKWLIDKNRIFPHLTYKMMKMEITIEEFVPNARSIRVGIVGDSDKEENYYLTEHVNSKTWLKNHAPEEENTYSYQDRYQLGIEHIDELIQETKEMATRYHANLIGVDWVIGENKTGLLELNDMIGIPDGEFASRLFYREIKKMCENHFLKLNEIN